MRPAALQPAWPSARRTPAALCPTMPHAWRPAPVPAAVRLTQRRALLVPVSACAFAHGVALAEANEWST